MQVKKQFVRYISHEIRTPLNTVSMGLLLLEQEVKEGASTTVLLGILEDIKESCKASLEVVNDFLLFDKISSGNVALELSPVHVVGFVESCVRSFRIQVCVPLRS